MKILDYPLMLLARTLLLALYLCALPFVLLYLGLTPQGHGRLRYVVYLLGNFAFDVFATLIAPILPLFATVQLGNSDNNNARLYEPRLPKWLSWFQTPDNSLYGDKGWQTIHSPAYKSYLGQVLWLVRNSAYGLIYGPLSAKFEHVACIRSIGNPRLDRHNPDHVGQTFLAWYKDYFQYMAILKVPFLMRSIYVNFGWLFDPFVENPATTDAYRAPLKFSIKPGVTLETNDDPLAGWELILTWVLIIVATGLMWWAMIEYVFLPTLHMLGGMFRLFALR